ncbi:hypothetical protein [uncultured Sphingomonas sp.]|uniref:hypothetical protein n=1 Tax=uncultured Sphingomonas sp. TaxID=158754 RepID=UPI0025DD8721|nr:hypothetical protein [uncultured Sphingomonas sp.]
MAALRQVIGGAGMICGALFAASYWKLIHINPTLEKGFMVCFCATLFAMNVVELWADRKARTRKA